MGTQPYSAPDTAASSIPGGYQRPAIATLLLVGLLALFFSAGFWQLDRAAEKRAVLNDSVRAASEERLTHLVENSLADSYRFRKLELSGRYLTERQVLLDNMTYNGRNGYQVLTPFQVGSQYVLVNRGWVEADSKREQLPDIGVGAEEQTLIARLNTFPAPGLRLENAEPMNTGWPQRLLFPDHAQLEKVLALPLKNYQLQLDPAQPNGYLRDWRAIASEPEKHLGYAMQWFSFAGLACLFYLILMYQWWRSRKAVAAHLARTSNAS